MLVEDPIYEWNSLLGLQEKKIIDRFRNWKTVEGAWVT